MADIDIIGGSAAGLFAGYLLARGGKQVRLFDANDVLNVDSRTLITTSRLSEALGFSPEEAVVNRIDRIDLLLSDAPGDTSPISATPHQSTTPSQED